MLGTSENLLCSLEQFTGTENYYRHSLARNILYTDGIQFLAEEANCYWLIDVIASYQGEKKFKNETFQLWILTKNTVLNKTPEDKGCVIECWTDTPGSEGSICLARQEIEHTDFPLQEFQCYCEGDISQRVILLKSEH